MVGTDNVDFDDFSIIDDYDVDVVGCLILVVLLFISINLFVIVLLSLLIESDCRYVLSYVLNLLINCYRVILLIVYKLTLPSIDTPT